MQISCDAINVDLSSQLIDNTRNESMDIKFMMEGAISRVNVNRGSVCVCFVGGFFKRFPYQPQMFNCLLWLGDGLAITIHNLIIVVRSSCNLHTDTQTHTRHD